MASIQFVNLKEVMDGMKKRTAKLEQIPKVARQMGVLATNEIHPLTAKKSHTWDNSIHAEVHQLKSFVWELWVGSKGAFTETGYNYGAYQERTRHPIERGWFIAEPRMKDLWRQVMHGESSNLVDIGSFTDEFASMAGF